MAPVPTQPLIRIPGSAQPADSPTRSLPPSLREITVYNSSGLTKEDSKSLRDEHQELEEILYSLDYTKLSSPEFGPKFKSALKHFIEHSDHEERGAIGGSAAGQTHEGGSLTALAQKLSGDDNHKLAQEFVAARKVVPTRPHPLAPQNGGLLQKILGMGTKIPHDKIVETLQGKTFIPVEELRYRKSPSRPRPHYRTNPLTNSFLFDSQSTRRTARSSPSSSTASCSTERS